MIPVKASALWSDENVRVMTRDVQEQGVLHVYYTCGK